MKKENKAIKDIILRDIRFLFDDDDGAETYYNAIRVTIFGITIIMNTKMLIEIKHYQLKNI